MKHNCAAIQYPIGLEDQLQGLVDLVQNRAFFFHGVHGCVPEITIVLLVIDGKSYEVGCICLSLHWLYLCFPPLLFSVSNGYVVKFVL